MIISALVMSGVKSGASLSNSEIENKARGLGMKYPYEFKVINK